MTSFDNPEAKRLTRRHFLGVSAATAAGYGMSLAGLPTAASAATESVGTSSASAGIRPFHVSFAQEALINLRRRVDATRRPMWETVTDDSQGVRLATMQQLARYWTIKYDWCKVERRLNALPQFMTNRPQTLYGIEDSPIGLAAWTMTPPAKR